MRRALLLFSVVATGCFTDPSPPNDPVTMYAKKDGVILQGAGVVMKYGEALRFDRCDSTTCYLMRTGKQATVVKSDLVDAPPPKSPQYVVGVAKVSSTKPLAIVAYDPGTGKALLADRSLWVPTGNLQDHPETPEEQKNRLTAEAADRADRALRARQEATREREEKRQARVNAGREALSAAADRKAYAATLRDHFLDQGLNIKVEVQGKAADHLVLRYILFDEVWVHKFQKGDLIEEIRGKGFKRVDFDGMESVFYVKLGS